MNYSDSDSKIWLQLLGKCFYGVNIMPVCVPAPTLSFQSDLLVGFRLVHGSIHICCKNEILLYPHFLSPKRKIRYSLPTVGWIPHEKIHHWVFVVHMLFYKKKKYYSEC